MAKTKTAISGKLAAASEGALSNFGLWIAGTFRNQSRDFNQLLGVTVVLVIFGSMMVLSASYVDALKAGNGAYSVFLKQAFSAAAGLFGMGVISRIPVAGLRRLTRPFFMLALGAQIVVLAFGTAVNGNKNWISIGGLFSLQPSEFLKLAMIMHIALFLANNDDLLDDPRKSWWPAFFSGAIAMGAVILGSDLGTVIVMFLIVVVQLSIAGMPRRLVGFIVGAAVVAIPVAVNMSASRAARVMAWLNPSAPDPLDVNWQAKHGVWALAAGGIGGTGFGDSKMKWSWIPEVENDFIFAIVGEEFGLIGAIVVISLFITLGFILVKITLKTKSLYERYILFGIMGWIVLQAMVNIAVVLNFLPVLGVPLPLISSGGSSLLATLAAIGVALGIERRNGAGPIARTRQVRRR
ncbi:MAG: FtsW/RodA/SpoVE family cell cycle protein [Micrococcales bacterium]